MSTTLYPGLHALFIWWFSTGAVFYLNGLPRRTFPWTMAAATALLAWGLYGLASGVDDTSIAGAYGGFLGALAVWIWIEVSFYLGYVTGIRKTPSTPQAGAWRHFGNAIAACLWHEVAILAALAVIAALSWGHANQVGLWTFAVLKWMHQSARLNVFLGVRNLNLSFLPPHLQFLSGYFRQRAMNMLFPVSVTLSTIAALLIFQAAATADAFTRTGLAFVGTLMVLAILEHWFLMLPLNVSALWAWALRPERRMAVAEEGVVVPLARRAKVLRA